MPGESRLMPAELAARRCCLRAFAQRPPLDTPGAGVADVGHAPAGVKPGIPTHTHNRERGRRPPVLVQGVAQTLTL